MGKKKDLTNMRFGRLTVIKESPTRGSGNRVRWICKCDCGNTTVVSSLSLLRFDTKSCGCLRSEMVAAKNSSHKLSRTRIYRIWGGIISRCEISSSSSFKNYGGRGIKVCDEWRESFLNFYNWAIMNGYNDKLTIERLDVNGDYSPQNCKWISIKEQHNNTRQSHFITIGEKTMDIKQWSEYVGISDKIVRGRLKSGWSEYNAVMIPKITKEELSEKRGIYNQKKK